MPTPPREARTYLRDLCDLCDKETHCQIARVVEQLQRWAIAARQGDLTQINTWSVKRIIIVIMIMTLLIREPYRLLFPLGLLFIAVGLGLWLMGSQWERLPMPTLAHMALMAVGFVGAVSCGFLLTMLPNLMNTPPATLAWTASAVVWGLLGLAALLLGFTQVLGPLIGAYALLILCFAASRMRQAQRLPPPRMVLAVVALINAVVLGVASLAGIMGMVLPAWLRGSMQDLAGHGILLVLVAAIAGFLLPRLAVVGKADPNCLAPEPGPVWKYVAYALLGLLIIASYLGQRWVQVMGEGFASPGHYAWAIVRALIITVLLAPTLWLQGKQPKYLRCAQSAIYSMLIGLWGAALHPQLAISWQHLVFVGGFLLLTLIIAARVISTHAGRSDLLDQRGCWVVVLTVLVHTASCSRMGAEWAPRSYDTHLILGSLFALIAMAQWAWRYAPLLTQAPPPVQQGDQYEKPHDTSA